MSGLQLIPSPDLDAKSTFETLGTDFKLDTLVVQYLLKIGLDSLEEFRFFWDAEEKIDGWLAKVGIKEAQLARSQTPQGMGRSATVVHPSRTGSI